MFDLTGFQRDLLRFIDSFNGKPKGTRLKKLLEQYYDQEINHGRLYPNLDDLENKGLIQKGEKDDRTNEYSMTTRGERVINERDEWNGDPVEKTKQLKAAE